MEWQQYLLENWEFKLVSAILILAAWIDGRQLRVPNWITFPMVLAGLVFGAVTGGFAGLGESALGMVVGLACLLPLYAVGGMGAGDVKLMAGMGAWLGATVTWHAFCVSVIVGAIMAIVMAFTNGKFKQHYANFTMIFLEWTQIRDPRKLSAIAAERKPTMTLLPYGIPICIGSIAYFLYEGKI